MANYFKSREGLKAYEKVGLPYPEWIMDECYENWKRDWIEHMPRSKKVEQYIGRMIRVRDVDGKDYIVHDMLEYGFDHTGKNRHQL